MIVRGRPSWDVFFMLQAHLAATRSTCSRGPLLLFDPERAGVGAVLVKENRVIAGGYNGSPPGQPHCNELRCGSCGAPAPDDGKVGDQCKRWVPERTSSMPGVIGCRNAPCRGELEGGHIMRNDSCVRTIHAEENALIQCAMDGVSPEGATMYTTASPCWDCSKRAIRMGIRRIVYGAQYSSRYGLSDEVSSLLRGARVKVDRIDVMEAENVVMTVKL